MSEISTGIIQNKRKEIASRMSLLDTDLYRDEQPTQDPKVLDLSVLKDYVSKVLDFHSTDSTNVDNNRKWSYVIDFELRHVLGKVNEPQWVAMLEAGLKWCIDTVTGEQPNGKWELHAYEFKMESRVFNRNRTVGRDDKGKAQFQKVSEQIDFLIVGMQFVDIKGELDMINEMGRPTTRKNNQLDPKLIQALLLQNQSGQTASNPEMDGLVKSQQKQISAQEEQLNRQSEEISQQKDMIEEMKAKQDKTNDLMAALMTEIKQQRAVSETKTTRRKRS